ncbi:hypothetical protein ACHAXH_005858 [Discostella pseudostelligera]
MSASAPIAAIPGGGGGFSTAVGVPASTTVIMSSLATVLFASTTSANETATATVGTCVSDDECTATVRSRYPSQSSTGVGLCECYAASTVAPFDECEGFTQNCIVARCMNGCAGFEGYCLLDTESSANGTCELRQVTETAESNSPISWGSPSTSPDSSNITSSAANETEVVGMCTSDEECSAVVRSQSPTVSQAGVELCECYARSIAFPFDECEGEVTDCMMAKCMDNCAGFEGYCQFPAESTDGTCVLRNITSSAAANETVVVGGCTSDEECTATVRSSSPTESNVGVELCECYSASSTSPFDECEGEVTDCMMAKCMNNCDGYEGYCLLAAESSTDGTCALRQLTETDESNSPTGSPSATSTKESIAPAANETVGMCTSDEECTAIVRSQSPTESNAGVELCECYAASSTNPFDECEGEEMDCMVAKCTDSCAGFEGYCLLSPDSADGTKTCVLRQLSTTSSPVSGNSPTTSPSPADINTAADKTVGTCASDDECSAVVRSRMPPQSNAGVYLCDCYAASSTAPFDECEGEGDETCAIAKCMNSCDGMGMEAYCLLSSESSDGTCTLRQASTNPSNPVSGSSPTTSPPSTSASATTKEVEVDSAQSGALMKRSQRFMMSMSVIVVIVFVVMFM